MRHRWRGAKAYIYRVQVCAKCGLRRRSRFRPFGSSGAMMLVDEFRWPGGKWTERRTAKPCFGGQRGAAK
jgi:hypothetical protein